MKVSFNWLKTYVKTALKPEEVAALLTSGGLEVESTEKSETVKGGLAGLVVGEVLSREKHPDADRLSVTKVNVGGAVPLQIVCGAANVAAGQKVVVALEGTKLYPTQGEPFVIKKSKIRGQASEGMICAEDEIGLGTSHDGIMVLKPETPVGMQAKDYFKIEEDVVFEIGLTPNRADAASHLGVARDLVALLHCHVPAEKEISLDLPSVSAFREGPKTNTLSVKVMDPEACPRYSGVLISGVKVSESPDWLKNRLAAIGLRPINNIVDITNFVLHELGQPLHAFDAAKIKGGQVIVRKAVPGTKFITLDEKERVLVGEDLMICNADEPMCIAGIFGGIGSGVTEKTTEIFLESACFHPTSIRKSSRQHGLKTDASFRFERGTDPEITVYAVKRAALLIAELAGGTVSSELIDHYPVPVQHFKIPFAFDHCDRLIGKKIEHDTIRQILKSLDISIESESKDALLLSVPPRKVDVTRECDVVEEILRIYGYNNVEFPQGLHASLSYTSKPDPVKWQSTISDQLSQNGFAEILNNSLTKGAYYESAPFSKEQSVELLNPLSSDLNVMRQSLLFGGLESIAYNQKRQHADLKFYEFGRVYLRSANGFHENNRLALFLTGRKMPENWNAGKEPVDFFRLKAYVQNIFTRMGIQITQVSESANELFAAGLQFSAQKKVLAELGVLKKSVLKQTDTAGEVLYADLNWDLMLSMVPKKDIVYHEIPKFPSVRRDLALILDQKVQFKEVEQLAYQTEKALLKQVSLFDVYEGEKLGAGKKSYALSFILQDEQNTLTDKQIEKIMEKLMKTYQEKLGAIIRS